MRYEELVMSSGGIYMVHYIGALMALNEYFPLQKFKYYTGCSAGAILSFLLVCGYDVNELYEEIINIDITEYQDLKIANFLDEYGFDNGEKTYQLLKHFFDKKKMDPHITFLELFEKTDKILTFAVTNITKKSSEYHNVFSTPYAKVVDSLFMTMNIPFLFKPIKKSITYMGVEQEDHYYVDGALLDPFPWKVMKRVVPTKKIGIFQYHREEEESQNDFMGSLQSYFTQMIKTFEKSLLKEKYKFLKDDKQTKNIFFIYDPNIQSTNFQMSRELKDYYIHDIKMKFNDFYFKTRRSEYLSKKYFYIWYSKIRKSGST